MNGLPATKHDVQTLDAQPVGGGSNSGCEYDEMIAVRCLEGQRIRSGGRHTFERSTNVWQTPWNRATSSYAFVWATSGRREGSCHFAVCSQNSPSGWRTDSCAELSIAKRRLLSLGESNRKGRTLEVPPSSLCYRNFDGSPRVQCVTPLHHRVQGGKDSHLTSSSTGANIFLELRFSMIRARGRCSRVSGFSSANSSDPIHAFFPPDSIPPTFITRDRRRSRHPPHTHFSICPPTFQRSTITQ